MSNDPEESSVLEVMDQDYDQPVLGVDWPSEAASGGETHQAIREIEPGRDESQAAIDDDDDDDDRDSESRRERVQRPPRVLGDPPIPAALAQVSFRIEPALLHEFKLRARARNVTVQAAGADALSLWLRSTAPPK